MSFLFLHNLTTRPVNPTTGEKEYKVQDHLGSTRLTIAESGTVAGQYDYDAWGEVIWQSDAPPRKGFIDKEIDKESNLGDYGLRKYDKTLARFLSIDSHWEEYPSLSPYNYAGNNPLIIKDPTGKVFDFSATSGDKTEQAEAAALVNEAIDYLVENGAEEEAQILIQLRDREDIVVKMHVMQESEQLFAGQYRWATGTLTWHPYTGGRNTDGSTTSPALSLLHEGGHALRHLDAKSKRTQPGVASSEEIKYMSDNRQETDPQYHTREERRVIVEIETPAAIKLGEGTRTDHQQEDIRVSGPTSRVPIEKK